MSKNIDLGTFTWDSTKLTDQIASNYAEVQRLSNGLKKTQEELKKTGKSISDLEAKVESEYHTQEKLNKSLNEGVISQDEYKSALAQSNAVIEISISEQKELIKYQSAYVISTIETQTQIKGLNNEQKELTKLMQAGQTEINGSERAYAGLTAKLSNAKLEAKNLGAQLFILGDSVDKNSAEYTQLSARYDEASAKANGLNDELKTLDASVGDNQRNVGAYKEAITSAFSEIGQGSIQLASGNITGGFESIKSGFNGIRTAALESYAVILSNPLTALIATFSALAVGIGLGVKEIFDYNSAIKESAKLTEDLTGVTGQSADDIRIRTQALADTFGGEFKEVLQTTNALAKQLGISYDEAFDKIEEGYVRGANASGDFLDRLKEYGPLLGKYGFDISEIIGLQIQAQEQGFFNDKFQDSLKEAGISLEEFTKAQSDALTKGFGKEFSDKISADINSGTLTVKDSLLLMGQEAKKQGLTVQEFGTLTADVFKGAGEDAGGAVVIFENLFDGIDKLKQPLTEAQQRTLDLSEATLQLGIAKDEALKSDSILAFQSAWEIATLNITAGFYKFIEALVEGVKWIDEFTGTSQILFEIYKVGESVIQSIKSIFDDFVGILSTLSEALGLNNTQSGAFLKTLASFFNPINVIKGLFQALAVVLDTVQNKIALARVEVVAFVNTVKTVFGQLSSAISSFDISSPIESLKKFAAINITGTFQKAREEAEKAIKVKKDLDKAFKEDEKKADADKLAAAKARAAADAKAKADAKAPAKSSTSPTAQTNRNESQKLADARREQKEAEKELEKENKRQLDIAKETASQKMDIAKSELADYISLNADKYKDEETLLRKKLADQNAYFDEVKRLQLVANEEERKSKDFAVQQKIDEIEKKKVLSENDRAEIINLKADLDIINQEYARKEIELTRQTDEKKLQVNEKYAQQVQKQKDVAQAIDFQRRLVALESENASEFEIRQLQLQQITEQELDAFLTENELKREADQENYDIKQEIEFQRKEIQNEIDLIDDENEKLRLQNKLNGLNLIEEANATASKKIVELTEEQKLSQVEDTFGNIATLLGKNTAAGKAAGIAQATINTFQGVTEVLKTPSALPEPFASVSRAINVGSVIASGLGAVKKITAVSTPKAERGMVIKGASHSNGGVPIITPNGIIEAEGEEIIINRNSSRLFASELSAINEAGGGRKLFANGGITSGKISGIQNSISSGINFDLMAEKIGNAVFEGATAGTSNGSQQGIENLNSNIKIQKGANF